MQTQFLMLAQDAEAAKELPSQSLLQYIHDGGFLSYVLVCISFVAVALVIRNLIIISRNRLAPPDVFQRLSELLKDNDVEGALAYTASPENNSFLSRVFGSALLRCSRSPFGFLELRSALEESGTREADKLHRANDGIGIIAAIGPMLGLLGTVIGMIGAFRSIGMLEGTARSQQLAVFMSIALVNTAEGLIVAIPCTVAFSLFRRKIDHLVGEIAGDIETLTRYLEHAPTESATGGAGKHAAPAKPAPPRPATAGTVRPIESTRGAQAS